MPISPGVPSNHQPRWWQEQLFKDHEVYQAHVVVGWIPSLGHAQAQIELRDPVHDELLDLVALPTIEQGDRPETIVAAVHDALEDVLQRNVSPF